MRNNIIRSILLGTAAIILAFALAVGSSLLANCAAEQPDSGVSASEIS